MCKRGRKVSGALDTSDSGARMPVPLVNGSDEGTLLITAGMQLILSAMRDARRIKA